MFWSNKKKKLDMIQAIRPTSKATLKIQCLFACKGDIDEAMKLYDYFAKDMPALPDYDPVPPTWVDNTKEAVNGFMGWIKENQDMLAQGYEFIRGAVRRRGMDAVADATDTVAGVMPGMVAGDAEAVALPSINE